MRRRGCPPAPGASAAQPMGRCGSFEGETTPVKSRNSNPAANTPPNVQLPMGAHRSGTAGGGSRASEEVAVAATGIADDERWFAQISTHITGIAHHKGEVGDREEVAFEGKRVVNAGKEQIGWLPKEISGLLLPIIYRQGGGMHLEGIVPRGSKNKFKVPLDLQVYGRAADADIIEATICEIAQAAPQFAGLSVIRAPVKGGIRVIHLEEELRSQAKEEVKGLNFPQLVGTRAKARETPRESDLENLFEPPVAYEQMPVAAVPHDLKTELYEHQRKALFWMTTREEALTAEQARERGVPCLWVRELTKRGVVRYRNQITNMTVTEPPKLPRGGVLADDMGMGKTITLVALLLARGGPTLVVCPLSVLSSWEDQLRRFAPKLVVYTYHGHGKNPDPSFLLKHDVVLTTYRTVEQGALKAIKWLRVVLDEAHEIRNPATLQSKACAAISAQVRWCVTGTPLFNGLKDLYALVAFVGIEPFNEYCWWLRMIARPAKAGNPCGLVHLCKLLGTCLLRRTKDLQVKAPDGSLRPVLQLPEKSARVERIPLCEDAKALYDRFFAFALRRVKGFAKDELGRQFSHILCILTQLRQFCCAPELLPPVLLRTLRQEGAGSSGHEFTRLEQAITNLDSAQKSRLLRHVAEAPGTECSICLDPLLAQEPCATSCLHLFHKSCLMDWLRTKNHRCPFCNSSCEERQVIALPEQGLEEVISDVVENTEGMRGPPAPESSKLVWAVNNLIQRTNEGHKVVVFSHFVRLLQLLEARLRSAGVGVAFVHGSLPQDKRANSFTAFQTDSKMQVILCSMRCAGVGVTLACADTVLILDPWWNMSVEEQAVDRVHRIGQKSRVEVVRLVAQDTVEEQIMTVQTLKRSIFDVALSRGSGSEAANTRMDAVMSIFRGPWAMASGGGAAGRSESAPGGAPGAALAAPGRRTSTPRGAGRGGAGVKRKRVGV